MEGPTVEYLGSRPIHVSGGHRFGTDAFLLASFANARPKEKVCDLGSGCGIIPLLLLRAPQPPAHVTALEIDPDAVALMELTRADNKLAQAFTPVLGDLRAPPPLLKAGSFDLVTCNPPYFLPGAGAQSPDPARSRARSEGCCTLGDVCRAAARLLRYGGRFCLCHRPERLCDVVSALRGCNLEPKRLRPVLQRRGAAPWLLLWEARLGGNPGLEIAPALVVEHPDGGFSDEMLTIYQKTRRLPSKEAPGQLLQSAHVSQNRRNS